MMDAKARQDCVKEIDLLKVKFIKANVLNGSKGKGSRLFIALKDLPVNW